MNSERWGLQVREKNCNFEAEKKMTERGGRKRGKEEKRRKRRGDGGEGTNKREYYECDI